VNKFDKSFYKGFNKSDLQKLPVNYQLLTFLQFEKDIITADNDEGFNGIEVKKYNGKFLTSEKHYSPISKIIDFE
jgi:hypothetical protein